MGEVRIDPSASLNTGTAASINGAATIHAALSDESDSTYIFYDEGVISFDTVIAMSFNNVRSGVPSDAKVVGLSFWMRHKSNLEGRFFFFVEYVLAQNHVIRKNAAEWPVGLIFDGTYQEHTTAVTQKANAGGFGELFWDTILSSSTFDIVVGVQVWGGALTTESRIEMSEAELVVVYNEPPEVTNVEPVGLSGGEITTIQPTITWDYSDPEGDPQVQYRVIIGDNTVDDALGNSPGDAGFNPELWGAGLAYDSGVVTSSAKSHNLTEPLVNGVTYRAYVRAYQPDVAGQDHYSAWEDSATFLTNAPGPSTFTVRANNRGDEGFIEIVGWDNNDGGVGRTPEQFDLECTFDGGSTFEKCRGHETQLMDTETMGLRLPGTAGHFASTADHASLDITSDIDIRWWGTSTDIALGHFFAGKWGGAGQRSWRVVGLFGFLAFIWTENGTTEKSGQSNVSLLDSGVIEQDQPIWLRCTADFQASQTVVTFYYSTEWTDSPTNWIVLGDPQVVTGASSIFNSTAALTVGATSAEAGSPAVHRMLQVRNGIGGTIVANPKFYERDIGSGSFSDSAGRSWSTTGANARYTRGFRHLDYEAPHNVPITYRARSAEFDDPNQYYSAFTSSDSVTMLLTTDRWWLKLPEMEEYNQLVDMSPGALDAIYPKARARYQPLGSRTPVILTDGLKGGQWTLRLEFNSYDEFEAFMELAEQDLTVFVQAAFPGWTEGRYLSLGNVHTELQDVAGEFWQVRVEADEVIRP